MLLTGLVACRIADIDFAKCRVLLVTRYYEYHFGPFAYDATAAVTLIFTAVVQPPIVNSFGRYAPVSA